MEPNEMLDFVKALSHADRLRVIGVLAQRNASTKEISEILGMPFREVFQHLAMLSEFGIVLERAGVWEIDTQNMGELARRQLEVQKRTAYGPTPDLSEKPRKVLAAYLNPDGSIRQLPHEPKKLQIILDYILESFTPGVIYTEKEVNMIIRRFHIDTAGLRRDMIDRGMMERKSDGSQYWRPEKADSKVS